MNKEIKYGDYVQVNDRFETCHIWSEELEKRNAGRYIPVKITYGQYVEYLNSQEPEHPTAMEEYKHQTSLQVENSLPNAITILVDELIKDKSEGSYYYGWQSSIAMVFYDEWRRYDEKGYCKLDHLHRIANNAAKNFLDTLCVQPSPQVKDSETGANVC